MRKLPNCVERVAVAAISGFLVLQGCTTAQEIRRQNGEAQYLIGCGSGTGWNICYARANELCPKGYNTLSEEAGFNRKELRISCPANE